MNWSWYLLEGVNPEPWTASEASVGKKGGKHFVSFHKPPQLRNYQESIKEMFPQQNPHAVERAGSLDLLFYFWRQLPLHEFEEGKKRRRAHVADATNLQKALEDALQGILYKNDRDIHSVRSVIVEQEATTEPAILVAIGDYVESEERTHVEAIRAALRLVPDSAASDADANFRHFDVDDTF